MPLPAGECTADLTERQIRHAMCDDAVVVDDRRPVLVGASTVVQRSAVGALPGDGAVALMAAALGRAIADAGAPGVAAVIDAIVVPRGAWRHPNPGRVIAATAGCGAPQSIVADIGVLQQSLVTWAATVIAAGEHRAVAIVGGEAMARRRVASSAGIELEAELGSDGVAEPDEVWSPAAEIITPMEIERDLAVPAHQYALVESVLAHRAGRTPREQERHVAALWASASSVAATNPDAWSPAAWTADELATDERGNRMLATPYRRWCVSDWTVDQAAALVVIAAGEARRLGIDESRWVSPVAAAESNHMVPLPARRDLAASPAWRLAGGVLAGAGVAPAHADHVELYSCFPAAVQVAAAELGVPLGDRPWTVTGGMTFAGGPLNNYHLVATAAMAARLRAAPGATGLLTCVSGLLTKVGATTWRSGIAAEPFAATDLTRGVAAATATRPLRPDLAGEAIVVAATVVHERGRPVRAVAVVEAADGGRAVARSVDPTVVARWVADDPIGLPVDVDGSGWLRPPA
jgi:acetyl-CoA C-acetyltransferase